MRLRAFGAAALAVLVATGCRAQSRAQAGPGAAGASCEEQQRDLAAFVEALPERALVGALSVDLPESTLGGVPGAGSVLEIAADQALFDGAPLAGRDPAERAESFRAALQGWTAPSPGPAVGNASARPALYVAAARETDIRTLRAFVVHVPASVELRVLVRTRAALPAQGGPTEQGQEIAARLLAERDPEARRAIAEQGYAAFSSCGDMANAVQGAARVEARGRWPALRAGMRVAIPRCGCDELDAPNLRPLLLAEQRAGTATLGALPVSFVRDERCGASMPLRSVGKLVQQMERFDEEFAGGWQRDALAFEQVLTNERLLNVFCNALPGETLAALEKARATLYWRIAGTDACQGWKFEPLSPGAPMGTWRRVAGPAPLAFHYWQAAEEIRLFGPLEGEPSKPTDTRAWACDQNQKLEGVDATSIQLESGRWFFSEAACRAAPADGAAAAGCAASLAAER